MSIAAVVLAAGEGVRFEGPGHKLLAPFGDSTVVGTAVDVALTASLDETIVVEGAVALDDQVPSSVTLVRNERWADGMASSLHIGCALAAAHGHDVVVVGLGDQPGITTESWKAVAAIDAAIAVATYDGARGHPVRLRSDVWPLLPIHGDVGARAVMRLRPDLVREVPCRGVPADIDTREDLEGWS